MAVETHIHAFPRHIADKTYPEAVPVYDSANKRIRIGDGSTVGGTEVPNMADLAAKAAASDVTELAGRVSDAENALAGKSDQSDLSDLSFSEKGDVLTLDCVNGDIRLSAVLNVMKNRFGQFTFEVQSSDLAFDHAKIIASALKSLQTGRGLRSLAFAFLPAEFTINDLQKVHELLLGKPVLAANFRRKMLPYLRATARMTGGDGHRPALIYTRNTDMED